MAAHARVTPSLIFLLFVFWPIRGLLWWMTDQSTARIGHPLFAPMLLLFATMPVSLLVTDQRRAGWLLLAYLALASPPLCS